MEKTIILKGKGIRDCEAFHLSENDFNFKAMEQYLVRCNYNDSSASCLCEAEKRKLYDDVINFLKQDDKNYTKFAIGGFSLEVWKDNGELYGSNYQRAAVVCDIHGIIDMDEGWCNETIGFLEKNPTLVESVTLDNDQLHNNEIRGYIGLVPIIVSTTIQKDPYLVFHSSKLN